MAYLKTALRRRRVVVLAGPRQCGKTTLARQLLSEKSVNYFDLEDPTDLARLDEPMTALSNLRGLVVIDEIQRRPDLFPILRVLVDSVSWRRDFIQTLLERDFPQWGVRVPAAALRRFWTMAAHYHGQTWNGAEPARALGVSESTVGRYLDLLTDALVIRQLQPHHANLKKRQVKSPKVYVRDSGLLHQLLGINGMKELLSHPKVGASWEGFVIEQVLTREPHDEVGFWATHQGAEMDLILRRGARLLGVECKRTDAPRMTPSIRIALEDLGLSRVAVLYPGAKRFMIAERVEAVPFSTLSKSPVFSEAGS